MIILRITLSKGEEKNYKSNIKLYNFYLIFFYIFNCQYYFTLRTRARVCQQVNVFRFNAIDAWWWWGFTARNKAWPAYFSRSEVRCLEVSCHSSRWILSIRISNKAVAGVKNVSRPSWIMCRKAEPPRHVYLLCFLSVIRGMVYAPVRPFSLYLSFCTTIIYPAPIIHPVSTIRRLRQSNYYHWN